MLQQTQVGTVIDYFNRFMERFPDIPALAAAKIDDVLKQWEGLGYYRRARQMHAAAQLIVEQHDGKFPGAFEQIHALPGIGRYTAGAIASIALEQRKPILEGNTIRLFSRLMVLDSDPRTGPNQKRLWEFSESVLPTKRVGDFNQALMDLGSMICKPGKPACLVCPVSQFCEARATGQQDVLPVSPDKKKYIVQDEAVVILQRDRKFFVRLCGPTQRWSGLWDFPRFILPSKIENPLRWLTEAAHAETGYRVKLSPWGQPIQHAVTKFKITLAIYQVDSISGRASTKKSEAAEWKWVTFSQLEALAMSSTGRKIVQRLAKTHAK